MSISMETKLSHPFIPPNRGVLSQPWQDHTARLEVRRLTSSVAIISAHGEIDESNAGALAEYTLEHVTGCRGLILDLRGLAFFGAKGFSALDKVSAGCARAGIGWALVPGAVVSRLLRICDPQGRLPAANTLVAALAKQLRTTEAAQCACDQEGRPATKVAPNAMTVTATSTLLRPSDAQRNVLDI